MRPLVSILIPAYNAERWIADTIRSALQQTWPQKEIIIVDDGSRDRTLQTARQFASKNVCVVTQENQGASAARNKAIQLCQGDYIQWLDADDLLAPDKIVKQVEALNRHESKRTLFSSPWGYFYYRVDKANFAATPLWCDLSPVEWLMRKMGQNLHMANSTWLVSRELTDAAGPWDIRLWKDNDGEYFCRVILACDCIRFIPEAKAFYRKSGPHSVTHIRRSQRKLESQLRSMCLHVRYLRSLDDSPRARTACLAYLQMRYLNFYPQRLDLVMQLQDLAAALGGQLKIPRLSWKYDWIQKILGRQIAKEVQLVVSERKEGLLRSWDKMMYSLGRNSGLPG